MKKVSFALLALLFCAGQSVASDELVLNYDGFFDRMDDLNEPEYQGVKLAFYFVDKNNVACEIESAELKTKLDRMEIYTLPSGEILLPFDEKLDQDKAHIVIKTKQANECGLNMRLESNQLLSAELSKKELIELHEKFSKALDDLGGMMSFMLPPVIGLTLEGNAEQQLKALNNDEITCSNNVCRVQATSLENVSSLQFNLAPSKITPWIGKAD